MIDYLIFSSFSSQYSRHHKSQPSKLGAEILRECSLPTRSCHVSHVKCQVSGVCYQRGLLHLVFKLLSFQSILMYPNKMCKLEQNLFCVKMVKKIYFLEGWTCYIKVHFATRSVCRSMFSWNSGLHLLYAILWFARPLFKNILDSPTQYLANATFGIRLAFQMREEYMK